MSDAPKHLRAGFRAEHTRKPAHKKRIEQACYDVIASKEYVTVDLGVTATTSEFAQAISSKL
jgi:isocitrate/isopropylmalate dehydrogenase